MNNLYSAKLIFFAILFYSLSCSVINLFTEKCGDQELASVFTEHSHEVYDVFLETFNLYEAQAKKGTLSFVYKCGG